MSNGTIAELTRQIASLTVIIEKLQAERSTPKLPFRPTTTAIDELIKAKTAGNRRDIYLKSLRYYLNRFAEVNPELTSVTVADVEAWLNRFPGHQSRQTWLNRVSTLFSFAVRRGWLPGNPCDQIDRIRIDRPAPFILSVDQSRALLAACPANCKPYLILGMYAGIRPDEIMRMDWTDIDLETATAKVNGKTRRRRHVPLHQLAVDLLGKCPDREGRVAPSHSTVRRWKRAARAIIGGKWVADCLRHTAASYLLALHGDAGKVATMLGNSPQVLLTHYHSPVAKAACELFWTTPQPEAAR